MRALMLIAAMPLAACSFHSGGNDNQPGVPASGTGTTRTFAVSDFTAVELRGSDDADVRVGPDFSVRAEGPADRLDQLKIERDGDTLRITRKSGSYSWGGGGRDVKVFVTMPTISAASIAGSGDLTIDRVEGSRFEGSTAGSGDLAVRAIKGGTVKLSIAGSGSIDASGTADDLSMSIAGSGDIDAGGLTASSGDVSVMGSGNATARINGRATVSLAGSGDVDLGDGATCTISKHGSGEVRCGH